MKYILVLTFAFFASIIYAQQTEVKKNGLELSISPVFLSNGKDIIKEIEYSYQGYSGVEKIKNLDIETKTGFSLGYRFLTFSQGIYKNYFKLEFSKNIKKLNFENDMEDVGQTPVEYEVDLKNKMLGISIENEFLLSKNFSAIFALGLNKNFLTFHEKIEPKFYNQYDKENEEACNFWIWKMNAGVRYYASKRVSLFSNVSYLNYPKTEIERSGYRIERIEGNYIYYFWVAEYEYEFNLNSMDINFGISYDF